MPRVLDQSGRWAVDAMESSNVRLTSGRIGLVSVDVQAPIASGIVERDEQALSLHLAISLDQLRTRSPIMQAAARALIRRHHASRLTFTGSGSTDEPWRVSGSARAGDVELPLSLDLTRLSTNDATGLEIAGTADVGTVNLPLPGLGRIDDFSFNVHSRLRVHLT